MRYVLSSWKMYTTVDRELALFDAIQTGLLDRLGPGTRLPRVILCPSFLSLVTLRADVDERVVRLGAQNCHWEPEGSYTGEISPRMLQGYVDYVLVGHSERRAAGETDEHVACKVAAVVDHGMVPILLVGEDVGDHGGSPEALARTEAQLRSGLARIDPSSTELLVVYEPVWAIGAEERAPAGHIERAVGHLRGVLGELGATGAGILYGGTVDDENVGELAALPGLDGVGTGRASLDPDRFLRIVDDFVPR